MIKTAEKINMQEEYSMLRKLLSDKYHDTDLALVDKAWEFAKIAHTGQKRLSGEPYVSHELRTAGILVGWNMDIPTILGGFLHDTIEDGGARREDIVDEFSEEVAALVDGVTKVSNIKLRGSKDEEFVENLRKMFLAMAKDLRVVFIKLADRFHNMQTLYALPEIKQKRIARETLEVFAPLAERLGMGELKGQLEDLAFPYVYPMEFEKIKRESVIHFKEAEKHIMKMRRNLLKKLAEEGVRDSVNARKKHLYSLWRKLERSGINWDYSKVHDMIALRILVEKMSDCYLALGVVHKTYKPVPGIGVSDFIAQPKPNGYQSIHTKVFGPGGRIVEVQIRSYEMHDQAEHGLAAHWAYAELKGSEKIQEEKLDKKGIVIPKNKLNWVKQLVDWQKEIKDSKEYIQAVKFDALSHRIFVFSPKGDVYDLPVGATPVDFAFAVHTGLGRFIKSAIVNGKIVPLDYKLQSGDVVEILKSKNPKEPTASWLDFVATTTAKHQISSYLRSKDEKI